MALVKSCFCCSLALACGFLALYLLIAYLIAFAFELLWILESTTPLPGAAVLLCVGYFALAIFSALLMHGLATKNTSCLLAWMFSVTILTFPEAGLVIYMSVHYWSVESLYGATELSSWTVRIVVNFIELVLVQSLYTTWKDEILVEKRLRDLEAAAMPISMDNLQHQQRPISLGQWYQNAAFGHSMEHLAVVNKKVPVWPAVPNNFYDLEHPYTTRSEFNASIFGVPNFIVNDTAGMTQKQKAQSMLDIRDLEYYQEPSIPAQKNQCNQPPPRMTKCASLDALNTNSPSSNIILNRTGFYARPMADYGVPIYYGPLDGPDFLVYRKQIDRLTSKNSLSNASADDVQKYRDVAL